MNAMPRCIWIDLDNSPHVPFFRPIIQELQRLGFAVSVTARDAFNVAELLRLHRIEATTIGRHYGKHKAMKLLGLGVRAVQLLPYVASHRPCLALSHGSRSQTLAARLTGVPSMVIADYEHVTHLTKPDWMIFPEVIPEAVTGRLSRHVLRYPGIKEDVYAASFTPDPALASALDIAAADIVSVRARQFRRPPRTEHLVPHALTLQPNTERPVAVTQGPLVAKAFRTASVSAKFRCSGMGGRRSGIADGLVATAAA